MECLQGHIRGCDLNFEKADEVMNVTTASNVNPQEVVTWLEEQKQLCHPVELDIRDAKRRINAAKGPQKGKKRKAEEPDEGSSDGAGSD